ncbi:hypothetical protein Tco_0007215 [Tanacetum coccineum]
MATMAENVIVAGAENRPPMLKKGMYDSWKSSILLYIKGKENGEMLIDSINKDHVDAFDSDCDEAPTASAIFMARLSLSSSVNGDVNATYDSDIL